MRGHAYFYIITNFQNSKKIWLLQQGATILFINDHERIAINIYSKHKFKPRARVCHRMIEGAYIYIITNFQNSKKNLILRNINILVRLGGLY